MHKVKDLLNQITQDHDSKDLIPKWEDMLLKHSKTLKEVSPVLYKELVEDLYISAYGEHFNKEMALEAVEEMLYVISDYKFNYTCEQIEGFITQAHQQSTQFMNKYGKMANEIPEEINKWDKYYTYHMICADYPLSHNGDANKIAMMSYEFLSDPDAPIGKAYRYYKAMEMKKIVD